MAEPELACGPGTGRAGSAWCAALGVRHTAREQGLECCQPRFFGENNSLVS